MASRLGFEPEEAAGMGAAFRRAIGTTGADVSPYELTLAGIDTGAAARYLGQRAPGYGAQGQDTATTLQRLIGTAQAGDLRGSKVDEYLSRLVALNQQAAEKGFKLDLESQAGFLEGLRGRGLEGMRGVQVAESLQGVAGGAYARMAAPLRQMAETMMVAQGFAGAPSYEKGLFNVGRMMADPNAAYRGLGTDRAARRLMLAGVAGPDALGLADVSGDLRAQGPMSLGGADLGGVPVSSLMARQSLERMTVARGRGGDTERLLGATQEAQVSLMRSASGDAAEKLVGFGNAILHVAEKMSAGIDALVKLNETRERTYEARETQQIIDGRLSDPYDFSQPSEPRGKI
jgi:hypothetical protein